MSKKPKVVYQSDKMYKLLEDEKHGLVLEVVVGTTALYAVQMPLNAAEKKGYAEKGTAYLDQLADEVVKNEPRYRKEGRTTPV